MRRLIDANKYPCRNCFHEYCYQNCKEFIEWFNNTVDAVEVVHGEWIRNEDDECCWYTCSECAEYPMRDRWGEEKLTDYCPNCGAKMDGDGNG